MNAAEVWRRLKRSRRRLGEPKNTRTKEGIAIKDVVTVAISVSALGLSLTTSYVSVFRQVDRLSVTFDTSRMSIDPVNGSNSLEATGHFTMLLVNSGTRPAAFTRMSVSASVSDDFTNTGKCDEAYLGTDFEPSVVKEKGIEKVAVRFVTKSTDLEAYGGTRMRVDQKYTDVKHLIARVCITLWFATPSRIELSKQVELREFPMSGSIDVIEEVQRPSILWEDKVSIFGD